MTAREYFDAISPGFLNRITLADHAIWPFPA